jgi:hypothetical protein
VFEIVLPDVSEEFREFAAAFGGRLGRGRGEGKCLGLNAGKGRTGDKKGSDDGAEETVQADLDRGG